MANHPDKQEKANKILILENSLYMGGQERILYDILSRIDKQRFEIVICCLKEGGYLKEAFEALGITVYEKLLTFKYDISAYRKLSRILADEKVALIYSYIHLNTVFFAHLAMLTRSTKAWIVALHASGSRTGGRLIGPFKKMLLSRVTRFVALADAHKRYLIDTEGLPREKIDVIQNGVDIKKHHPGECDPSLKEELGIREGERVVTTIASLNRRKRHDLLLQSAANVLGTHPQVRFLIVGDGPERNRLEGLAQDLGIKTRVVFTGVRDDVDAILRASDLFVLSSMRGTETFPMVLLEAMASGVPIVSTDVGSVRELVAADENALVVPPENPDALTHAIETLLDDSEKARSFGEKGRQIVEKRFTLEQASEKTERLLSDVLTGIR